MRVRITRRDFCTSLNERYRQVTETRRSVGSIVADVPRAHFDDEAALNPMENLAESRRCTMAIEAES